MGGIGIHAWMPGHQIVEPSQHFWRLEYLYSRIIPFQPRDPTWNGRDKWRARNAANGRAEIGNPDRAAAFLPDTGQPFIGDGRLSTQDPTSHVAGSEIL